MLSYKARYNISENEYNVLFSDPDFFKNKSLLEKFLLLLNKKAEFKQEYEKKVTRNSSYWLNLLDLFYFYKNSASGSPENESYKKVNAYQHQIDKAILILINKLKSENSSEIIELLISELVKIKDYERLDIFYSLIKEILGFKKNNKNQDFIDKHLKRVLSSIKLEEDQKIIDGQKKNSISKSLRIIVDEKTEKSKLENSSSELEKSLKNNHFNEYHEEFKSFLSEFKDKISILEQKKDKVDQIPPHNHNYPRNIAILVTIGVFFMICSKLVFKNKKIKNN